MSPQRTLPCLLLVCLLGGVVLTPVAGRAQPAGEASSTPPSQAQDATLRSILRTIEQLERERAAKQEELRSPQAEGRHTEVTRQIEALSAKLDALRQDLNEVASGVARTAFARPPEDVALNWQRRVLELLGPLLNELERLTARPRAIDRLRTTMARYEEQQRLAGQALDNLRQLTATVDPDLVPPLRQLQHAWEQRQQEISTQVGIATQQLAQQLAQQRSLADGLRNLFALFFRSRGRNVLLAGLAAAACWGLLHWLHRGLRRWSPLHRRGSRFTVRLFDLGYTGATICGTVAASQLVLYLLDDWLLLTVSLLFLLGFVWTSRTMLPRFWGEVLLLLNLGSMREGERVVYNGIPWRVQSLHFSTHLVNPALLGGDIRLAVSDCLGLRSRPGPAEEPWFPTAIEDWVLLDAQTLAQVVLQTPEVVCLTLLGGSQRTVRTPDFLAQSPLVLSRGFGFQVRVSLDWQHQAQITRVLPAQLEARLRAEVEYAGYASDIQHLAVEFEDAGATAFTLVVLVTCPGTAAPRLLALRRALQRLCVEACTAFAWVLPYTQLAVTLTAPARTDAPGGCAASQTAGVPEQGPTGR